MAKASRLLPLLLLCAGCELLARESPGSAPAEETPKGKVERRQSVQSMGDAPEARPGRYGVPFAYETSPDEPLARARKFMAEVLQANDTFRAQGRERFTPFAEQETPRATVLTCSDSRVQAGAWDTSPENDDYTVRNLGNQLATSLGSVEYGVAHLHTPVLLIVGHTGCEAVETVLNEAAKGTGAIATELSRMKLAERRNGGGGAEWDSLTAAVVANVDAQVAEAVTHFSPFVQSGELTVVGAVYDFRNDLEAGHGRLRIVNVNGNVDAARLEAFEEAIEGDEKPSPPRFGARHGVSFGAGGRAQPGGAPRLIPGRPRATINAVNVLGAGGFDAVVNGTSKPPARRPRAILPGTSDLMLAAGARLPGTAREATPAHPAAGAEHGAVRAAPSSARASKDPDGARDPGPAPAAAQGLAIPAATHDAAPRGRRPPAPAPAAEHADSSGG